MQDTHWEPLDPISLRRHYTSFLQSGRILLTGHSHQAWPDVALEGQCQAFEDAATHVDDKWSLAFKQGDVIRQAVVQGLGGTLDEIALAANTHVLLARFLSGLDLRRRPHLVTTGGEFHSMSRQLQRLAETGLSVTVVPPTPVETLAGRLAQAIGPKTAAVLASTVLFETSALVPGLAEVTAAAQAVGAEVLYDAYHHVGVKPLSLTDLGGAQVFVLGGGYKYAQWGEGCCWLRVPTSCKMRPIYTGWFSTFGDLAAPPNPGAVPYGQTGALRFAGSTYDPTSHYRGARVVAFFKDQGMRIERLAAGYARQTDRLITGLSNLTLASPREASKRGGFVAFKIKEADQVVTKLRAQNIYVDARRGHLRIGPAPYTTDAELDEMIVKLQKICG